jgi:hypothetical protein
MKTPIIITSLLFISGGVLLANEQSSDSSYYANDIDAAVKEAEVSPNNEKHVGITARRQAALISPN